MWPNKWHVFVPSRKKEPKHFSHLRDFFLQTEIPFNNKGLDTLDINIVCVIYGQGSRSPNLATLAKREFCDFNISIEQHRSFCDFHYFYLNYKSIFSKF